MVVQKTLTGSVRVDGVELPLTRAVISQDMDDVDWGEVREFEQESEENGVNYAYLALRWVTRRYADGHTEDWINYSERRRKQEGLGSASGTGSIDPDELTESDLDEWLNGNPPHTLIRCDPSKFPNRAVFLSPKVRKYLDTPTLHQVTVTR
nr:hypothetical protein [uncultured archaeon]